MRPWTIYPKSAEHTAIALLVYAVPAVVLLAFYARYVGISRPKAFLLWLCSSIAGAAVTMFRSAEVEAGRFPMQFARRVELVYWVVLPGLLVTFVVPFVVKLYLRWFGEKATEKEKAAGMDGVRAWLGGGNLIMCILIALCAWRGLGYSFWGILALTVGCVVAYPLFNMLSQRPAGGPRPATEEMPREREKILNLLEAGKVTPEESAELLTALGESSAEPRGARVPMTVGRKLLLGGAALVLVGFFLPWYRVNLGQEMGRLTGGLRSFTNVPDEVRVFPPPPLKTPPRGLGPGVPVLSNATVNVCGADVGGKLGWAVLLLAAACAVLPYVATGLKRATQDTLTVVGLGIGAVILLYLLSQGLRHASVGLLVVLIGYGVQFVGAVKERRAPAG